MCQTSAGLYSRATSAGYLAAARALAVTCLLLSSAACASSAPSSGNSSPGSTSSSSVTNPALCADLQALSGDVDQLRALNPSTATAVEVQSLLNDAKSNLDKAAHDAAGLTSAKISAVQAAYTALVAVLSALPTSISGTQAFKQIQPQLTTLIAALDAAKIGTSCPSAATSTPS